MPPHRRGSVLSRSRSLSPSTCIYLLLLFIGVLGLTSFEVSDDNWSENEDGFDENGLDADNITGIVADAEAESEDDEEVEEDTDSESDEDDGLHINQAVEDDDEDFYCHPHHDKPCQQSCTSWSGTNKCARRTPGCVFPDAIPTGVGDYPCHPLSMQPCQRQCAIRGTEKFCAKHEHGSECVAAKTEEICVDPNVKCQQYRVSRVCKKFEEKKSTTEKKCIKFGTQRKCKEFEMANVCVKYEMANGERKCVKHKKDCDSAGNEKNECEKVEKCVEEDTEKTCVKYVTDPSGNPTCVKKELVTLKGECVRKPGKEYCVKRRPGPTECVEHCNEPRKCLKKCANEPPKCKKLCMKEKRCLKKCKPGCKKMCPGKQVCTKQCPKEKVCKRRCEGEKPCIEKCVEKGPCVRECGGEQECVRMCKEEPRCLKPCQQGGECTKQCTRPGPCAKTCTRQSKNCHQCGIIPKECHETEEWSKIWAEPHIRTLDGFRYNLVKMGHYWLSKPVPKLGFGFSAQAQVVPARQDGAPLHGSVFGAVAVECDGYVAEIYAVPHPHIIINGKAVDVSKAHALGRCGVVRPMEQEGDGDADESDGIEIGVLSPRYNVAVLISFSSLSGRDMDMFLDVNTRLDPKWRGFVEGGLWGDFNGVVGNYKPLDHLAKLRVSDEDSFFHETIEVPKNWHIYTEEEVAKMPEEQQARAKRACTRAKLEGSQLEACIYDVLATGESGFAREEKTAARRTAGDIVKFGWKDAVKKRADVNAVVSHKGVDTDSDETEGQNNSDSSDSITDSEPDVTLDDELDMDMSSSCSRSDGKCIDINKSTCGGTLKSGMCPGARNIKCCQPTTSSSRSLCQSSGGQCIDVNRTRCTGQIRVEMCPGASHIKCCFPFSGKPAPKRSPAARPNAGVDHCAAVRGTCLDINVSQCSGRTLVGKCPGPANVKCCVPGSGTRQAPAPPTDACRAQKKGTCIDTNRQQCGGPVVANMCPGPSNIRCCTPTTPGGKPDISSIKQQADIIWCKQSKRKPPKGAIIVDCPKSKCPADGGVRGRIDMCKIGPTKKINGVSYSLRWYKKITYKCTEEKPKMCCDDESYCCEQGQPESYCCETAPTTKGCCEWSQPSEICCEHRTTPKECCEYGPDVHTEQCCKWGEPAKKCCEWEPESTFCCKHKTEAASCCEQGEEECCEWSNAEQYCCEPGQSEDPGCCEWSEPTKKCCKEETKPPICIEWKKEPDGQDCKPDSTSEQCVKWSDPGKKCESYEITKKCKAKKMVCLDDSQPQHDCRETCVKWAVNQTKKCVKKESKRVCKVYDETRRCEEYATESAECPDACAAATKRTCLDWVQEKQCVRFKGVCEQWRKEKTCAKQRVSGKCLQWIENTTCQPQGSQSRRCRSDGCAAVAPPPPILY